ncbi:MAG: hypothetical protein E7536_02295 [Ruminococcaceae bacterium]|nr:hypothetical protein [Oscillospiraceae bacterium]
MSTFFANIVSVFISFFASFFGIFGIDIYKNGFDDIDFSAVKSISFSSELVLDDVHDGSHTILQGGCTDGKYAYFCSDNPNSDTCSISKYNIITWEEVARSAPVKVDHANDITYNKDKDCLVVCHNSPVRTRVSFVDKRSLEIIETFEIPLEIYSITYDAKNNRYAVGISYTFDFAILDKDFNVIKTVKGVKPKSTLKQGMDSDGKYIYFLLSSPNAISVYDWDGNHYGIFELNDEAKKYETENMFLINNELYIGYNSGYGKIYKTSFEATY